MFYERAIEEKQFLESHGHIRPPVGLKMNGEAYVAIGGTIYRQNRPGSYTFMNALHDHALTFLGEDFLTAEEQKPLEQRHPAAQWMQIYVTHSQHLHAQGNLDEAVARIGAGAAWFRFAHDLHTIKDNSKLEDVLKMRLLDGGRFQGARFELAVAALCVAAGYELQFEDESDGSKHHPEFIGIDKFSSERIAVEVKSRHRKGVKGFWGGKEEKLGATVGVRGLVIDAFKKSADLPLYIFVDVNLPAAAPGVLKKWTDEINQMMSDLGNEGYLTSCPANAVFFSNDPSHHMLDEQVGHEADAVWYMHFDLSDPKVAHPKGDALGRLLKAHEQRITPPADFPGFNNPQWDGNP